MQRRTACRRGRARTSSTSPARRATRRSTDPASSGLSLEAQSAEDGEGVARSDLPDEPTTRFDRDPRALRRLSLEALGQGHGVLMGRELDAHFPLRAALFERLGGFALLQALVLGLQLLPGPRHRY